MAKFAIECPVCGKYAEAKTGFFARKKIDCACGNIIDVRTDSITSRVCAHCSNAVVFDQRKGEAAICPVCKNSVNTTADIDRNVSIKCPQCGCGLSAGKTAMSYTCPVCDMVVDVQKEAQLAKIAETGIASVIKYEGGNDTFVWKHPVEDFNIGSQLIVHETQEAIFFRDGQALDTFTAGRWPLETGSIPLINKLYDSLLEPSSMFHSEVYFVNLTTQMGIKWGTDSRVRFMDPVTGMPLDIGASGEFNIRVTEPRRLVMKLVGTEGTLDRKTLLNTRVADAVGSAADGTSSQAVTGYFRSMIMTRVKSHLAKTIKDNSINILEIDEHLDALSDALRQRLNEGLAEYGLMMPEFFVTSVATPDDDPNFRKMKQQHAEQYLRVREEQVRKAEAEAAAERKAVEARTDAQMKIINAQGVAEIKKIDADADAEATRMRGQADADAYRMQAESEALEMKMKGYTYAQETQRQVGLEAMSGGIVKEGGAGGGMSDIVGLGVGLGAIGSVVGIAKDAIGPIAGTGAGIGAAFGGIMSQEASGEGTLWDCSCGKKGVSANFCDNCGSKRSDAKPEAPAAGAWDCSCGAQGVTANFCGNCGAKRPKTPEAWDCACGQAGITANFCGNCGAKKPEKPETWDCSCGQTGITANFCGNCGTKKAGAWDCAKCGNTGIKANFCDNCGAKKEENDNEA